MLNEISQAQKCKCRPIPSTTRTLGTRGTRGDRMHRNGRQSGGCRGRGDFFHGHGVLVSREEESQRWTTVMVPR